MNVITSGGVEGGLCIDTSRQTQDHVTVSMYNVHITAKYCINTKPVSCF